MSVQVTGRVAEKAVSPVTKHPIAPFARPVPRELPVNPVKLSLIYAVVVDGKALSNVKLKL